MMQSSISMLRWPIVFALVAFGSYVWNALSARGARWDLHHSRSYEMRMMPVRFSNGIAGRSVLPLETGDCVIMHVPPRYVTPEFIENSMKGDVENESDKLEIYREPEDGRWHIPENDLSQLSTFNCATYAIGDVMSLSQSDWLELRPTSWTKGLNPTKLLLDSYFDLVATFPWSPELPNSLQSNVLKPGDVVVFDATQGFCHLGKVHASETGNVLLSKLGIGPVVRGSISATANYYAKQVTAIQVYRRREAR